MLGGKSFGDAFANISLTQAAFSGAASMITGNVANGLATSAAKGSMTTALATGVTAATGSATSMAAYTGTSLVEGKAVTFEGLAVKAGLGAVGGARAGAISNNYGRSIEGLKGAKDGISNHLGTITQGSVFGKTAISPAAASTLGSQAVDAAKSTFAPANSNAGGNDDGK
jgi:hypothetical protein